MPFAAALRRSLQDRGREVPAEFERRDSLEDVLNRHLRTIEQMGGGDVFTCILLLSPDGKRLSVGAAPTLPASYCRPGDSFEIGLSHGSCAAAAYLGRAVYSVDIETDPIWADFGNVALEHGFKSCWSTPIRNSDDSIIGTFAILHRTVGRPSREEIDAIDLITEHVADAIMWARNLQGLVPRVSQPSTDVPALKLVWDNENPDNAVARLLKLADELLAKAADLDRHANRSETETGAEGLRKAAELSRKLVAHIMSQVELIRSGKSG